MRERERLLLWDGKLANAYGTEQQIYKHEEVGQQCHVLIAAAIATKPIPLQLLLHILRDAPLAEELEIITQQK